MLDWNPCQIYYPLEIKLLLLSHRGALAKFSSDRIPIVIETGRYRGVCIDERKCFSCKDIVDEI